MSYEATDSDLPGVLWANPLIGARDRIRNTAGEMGIRLEEDQVELFAIILIGLEETGGAALKS